MRGSSSQFDTRRHAHHRDASSRWSARTLAPPLSTDVTQDDVRPDAGRQGLYGTDGRMVGVGGWVGGERAFFNVSIVGVKHIIR